MTSRLKVHPFAAGTGIMDKLYRAFFNSTLSGPRARQMVIFLDDGGYLGEFTENMNARMLLWNGELNIYTFVSVDFDRALGGYFSVSVSVTPLSDSFITAFTDIFNIILGLALVTASVHLFADDLCELYHLLRKTADAASPITYVTTVFVSRGLGSFLVVWTLVVLVIIQGDGKATCDGVRRNDRVGKWTEQVWAKLYFGGRNPVEVNQDDYTRSNFLNLNEDEVEELEKMLLGSAYASDLRSIFWAVTSMTIVYMIFFTLGSFKCHPSLDIVRCTMIAMKEDIIHFGLSLAGYLPVCKNESVGGGHSTFYNFHSALIQITFAWLVLISCVNIFFSVISDGYQAIGTKNKEVGEDEGNFFVSIAREVHAWLARSARNSRMTSLRTVLEMASDGVDDATLEVLNSPSTPNTPKSPYPPNSPYSPYSPYSTTTPRSSFSNRSARMWRTPANQKAPLTIDMRMGGGMQLNAANVEAYLIRRVPEDLRTLKTHFQQLKRQNSQLKRQRSVEESAAAPRRGSVNLSALADELH
eukprot:gene8960-10615_t